MHTDIIQADKKASKLTEQVTISEPGLSDEKQAYCQQVWSITGQVLTIIIPVIVRPQLTSEFLK